MDKWYRHLVQRGNEKISYIRGIIAWTEMFATLDLSPVF